MEIDYVKLAWAAAYVVVLALAAGRDAWQRKIPNWTVLSLLALFLASLPSTWLIPGWLSSISACALVLAVGFPMFALRLMGAGDIKLLAVAALFAGMENLLLLCIATALAGGVMALAAVMARPYADAIAASGLPRPRPGVPYGVAIAIGALYVGFASGQLNIAHRLAHIDLG